MSSLYGRKKRGNTPSECFSTSCERESALEKLEKMGGRGKMARAGGGEGQRAVAFR